jgi:hypothetical protein
MPTLINRKNTYLQTNLTDDSISNTLRKIAKSVITSEFCPTKWRQPLILHLFWWH